MIDSHAHLEMEAFDHDRDQTIARALDSGVKTIVSLAMVDESRSYEKALPIVDGHEALLTAVGCHPHDAKIFDESGGESLVRRLVESPKVIAIGEIGLDYHYDWSPREAQREVFRRQMILARELSLPVVVHHREAEEDLASMLEDDSVRGVRGILHSFTAGRATAELAIAKGFLISFSGILTFNSAGGLRDVARALPLDKLLVETDAPYLAPVPHRGKRNEPLFVHHTAEVLASVKGVTPEVIEAATDENFRRFFDL
jgi:TatD DNase family protein